MRPPTQMVPITNAFVAEFAAEVRRDLALEPKQLQSKYLYDALGSSLFDAICRLPWYRITRAESRLLRRHAADIVAALRLAPPPVLGQSTALGLGGRSWPKRCSRQEGRLTCTSSTFRRRRSSRPSSA
jgi:hypothetical protein